MKFVKGKTALRRLSALDKLHENAKPLIMEVKDGFRQSIRDLLGNL